MSGTSELSPYFIERTRGQEKLARRNPPPPAAPDDEINLREYWRIIRRHLALIGAIVAGAILLAGVAVFTVTPVYTASALILINPQPPQVLDIKQLSVQPSAGEEQDYYKTQYALLRSRSLAATVIHDLGLKNRPLLSGGGAQGLLGELGGLWAEFTGALAAAPADAHERRGSVAGDGDGIPAGLIDAYLARLSIEPEFGTRLVRIAFSTPHPKLSAMVANAHARAYVRQGMDLRARASQAAERFLEGKLVELGDRVEKSEAALNSYRHDKGIVEFSTSSKNEILLKRLEDLNAALTKAETSRIGLEAQADLIGKGDYYSLPGVVTSPMVEALKPQLAEIEAKYTSMSDRYTLAYAPLAALKAKLDDTRAQLNQTVHQIVRSVKLRYQAAADLQQQLAKEVGQEKARALALNDASLKDAILAREVDTNRQLYESVLKRMKEMGVAATVHASNVSMVDHATPPPYPSSPRKALILALSAVLGLGTAVGVAFALEHLDDSLKTPEHVERLLRLPSLAFVPDMRGLANGGARRELGGSDAPAGLPAARNGARAKNGREAMRERSTLASALEAYRTIRSQLLLSRAGNPPRTVLVTSAVAEEGKSITAVNTAITFAQNGRRVVLVDADLRRARCHELLRCDGHKGLSEVLSGQAELDEVLAATAVKNLDLLSAGAVPPDPPELLGSARMDELLAQLCARYQHVIIDSAPVMPISDSVVLAQRVDGVLIVVGRTTSKQVVKRACLKMSDAGAKLLGAVLNRIGAHHASYYPYGNYQYYPYRERDGGAATDGHVQIVFD